MSCSAHICCCLTQVDQVDETCERTDDSKSASTASQLGMANLGGVFVFLIGGLTIALLTALIEFLINAFVNSKTDRVRRLYNSSMRKVCSDFSLLTENVTYNGFVACSYICPRTYQKGVFGICLLNNITWETWCNQYRLQKLTTALCGTFFVNRVKSLHTNNTWYVMSELWYQSCDVRAVMSYGGEK